MSGNYELKETYEPAPAYPSVLTIKSSNYVAVRLGPGVTLHFQNGLLVAADDLPGAKS